MSCSTKSVDMPDKRVFVSHMPTLFVGHGTQDFPRNKPPHPMTAKRTNPPTIIPAMLCIAMSLCAAGGCVGYNFGNRGLYPTDVQTVFVPVFESVSFRRNLGEQLTEAVAKEIENKTPYKVVGAAEADSVLSGRIVSETKRLVVANAADEPREVQVNLQVQVAWVDRRSNTIRRTEAIPLPPEFTDVSASGDVMPEVGSSVALAHQKAISRLAEQIVSLMEAPW